MVSSHDGDTPQRTWCASSSRGPGGEHHEEPPPQRISVDEVSIGHALIADALPRETARGSRGSDGSGALWPVSPRSGYLLGSSVAPSCRWGRRSLRTPISSPSVHRARAGRQCVRRPARGPGQPSPRARSASSRDPPASRPRALPLSRARPLPRADRRLKREERAPSGSDAGAVGDRPRHSCRPPRRPSAPPRP